MQKNTPVYSTGAWL